MFLAVPPYVFQILTAIALAGILCAFAFYKKWLDAGGAVSATAMGAIIWLAGGWQTTLPMLFFFVTGSFFSKLPNKKRIVADVKQDKARDYIQVLCNGGIAAICLVFWLASKQGYWLLAYCASLAISTADTWSSELGVRFGGKVVDIVNLKPLPTGISGGVSATGTLAGFAGSLLMGILCWLLLHFSLAETAIVVSAGFLGMLMDSLLGSRLQARYRLEDGTPAESALPNHTARLEKGFGWMTNDMVNILANLVTSAVVIFLATYLAQF